MTGFRSLSLGLAFLAAGFPGASAMAVDGDWSLAVAPNGVLYGETPCTSQEIEKLRSAPVSLPQGASMKQEERILCRKEQGAGETIVLAASPVKIPFKVSKSFVLFDYLWEQGMAASHREGEATLQQLGGRRAMLNRAELNGVLAQSGFIELDRTTVIFTYASGNLSDRIQLGSIIDRFNNSIGVNVS